jgi:hypothetical protein
MLSKNEQVIFSPCLYAFFYMLSLKLLHLKYFPQETKGYTHKLLLHSPFTVAWKLELLLTIRNDSRVKEKTGLCTDFASSCLTYLQCEGLHVTFKIILQVPVQGASCCHLLSGPG